MIFIFIYMYHGRKTNIVLRLFIWCVGVVAYFLLIVWMICIDFTVNWKTSDWKLSFFSYLQPSHLLLRLLPGFRYYSGVSAKCGQVSWRCMSLVSRESIHAKNEGMTWCLRVSGRDENVNGWEGSEDWIIGCKGSTC